MTRNQIAWFEANERARANLAAEEETRRSNFARENEQSRHNLEVEDQGRRSLIETHRSNTAQEELKRRDLDIRQDYNNRQIALSYKQFAETERSNRARELLAQQSNFLEQRKLIESRRHSLATESIARMESFRQAERDRRQHNLAYENFRELKRSNEVRERHESRRIDVQAQDVKTRLRAQKEQERANRQKENVSWFNAYNNTIGSAMKAAVSIVPLMFI